MKSRAQAPPLDSGADFAPLARRTLIAVAITALLVGACYLWVDRPVAYFVHAHELNRIETFRWLTYPPPELQHVAPALIGDFGPAAQDSVPCGAGNGHCSFRWSA